MEAERAVAATTSAEPARSLRLDQVIARKAREAGSSFARPKQLESAAHYAEHHRLRLTEAELVELTAVIDGYNERLAHLKDTEGRAVRAWAKERIALGDFELLEAGGSHSPGPSHLEETIEVHVSSARSQDWIQVVKIRRGENAIIDTLIDDMQSTAAAGQAAIAEYFAARRAASQGADGQANQDVGG